MCYIYLVGVNRTENELYTFVQDIRLVFVELSSFMPMQAHAHTHTHTLSHLFAVLGDGHAQWVFTAGLSCAHDSQNLPQGHAGLVPQH